jgi:hypothetical protein
LRTKKRARRVVDSKKFKFVSTTKRFQIVSATTADNTSNGRNGWFYRGILA